MRTAFRIRLDPRAIRLALAIALVLAVAATALPQKALAATCSRTHIVQEGETTGRIAHRYNLKWREIAKANNLKAPYQLEAGQQLCIPETDEDTDTATSPNMVLDVTVAGGRVFITINRLSYRSVFKVKGRPVEVGVGGWRNLGTLRAGKNERVNMVFALPAALKGSTYLSICLKDVTTDELICRSAVNIP